DGLVNPVDYIALLDPGFRGRPGLIHRNHNSTADLLQAQSPPNIGSHGLYGQPQFVCGLSVLAAATSAVPFFRRAGAPDIRRPIPQGNRGGLLLALTNEIDARV